MKENQPTDTPEEKDDFAALFEESFQEQTRFTPGQMIEAAIVKIDLSWIFLDVGRKGEGYLDRKEMIDADGNLTVKEGDNVRAYYLPSQGHDLHFTTKMGSGPMGQAQLRSACTSGIPVEGTIIKEMKGGFEVKISGGMRAFCPYSQMGLRREESPAEQVGKSFTFKVTECAARNVVLSRRSIVEGERQVMAQALKETLKEGQRLQATVTSIQKFGAFADVGGIEGLIPVSEIAWGRTENVGDKLKVGQQVEIIVKKIDWESNRISLSIKDALPDPWQNAEQTWPMGTYHHGTVTRLAPGQEVTYSATTLFGAVTGSRTVAVHKAGGLLGRRAAVTVTSEVAGPGAPLIPGPVLERSNVRFLLDLAAATEVKAA